MNEHSRKAAGSSNQHHPRRQHPGEQPEASNRTTGRMQIQDSRDQPSEPNKTKNTRSRRSSKAHARTEQQQDEDSSDWEKSSNSEEDWALLDANPPYQQNGPSHSTPSYDFPGTWPTALRDTSNALTEVSAATASFASALTQSGIGKASWSVTRALASSANKGALSLADWATDRTGTGADALPRPIGKWLKNGKEKMEGQRAAEARRLEKKERKKLRTERGRVQGETRFEDEEGLFTLETTDLSNTGEMIGEGRPVYRGSPSPEEKKREEEMWPVVRMKGGVEAVKEAMEEPGDDEEDGDGMVRMFQFDD